MPLLCLRMYCVRFTETKCFCYSSVHHAGAPDPVTGSLVASNRPAISEVLWRSCQDITEPPLSKSFKSIRLPISTTCSTPAPRSACSLDVYYFPFVNMCHCHGKIIIYLPCYWFLYCHCSMLCIRDGSCFNNIFCVKWSKFQLNDQSLVSKLVIKTINWESLKLIYWWWMYFLGTRFIMM